MPPRRKDKARPATPVHLVDTNVLFVDCSLAAQGKHRQIPIYTFDETDFKEAGRRLGKALSHLRWNFPSASARW